jgi:hypothetical protein
MKRVVVIALTVALVVLAVSFALVNAQGPGGATWVSSINVLNLDEAEDATIVLVFYGTEANPVSSYPLDPLPPSQSVEVYLPSIPDGVLPDGRYSVVIYSDKPVAAVGTLGGDIGAVHFVGSYSSVAADDATTPVYIPALLRNYYNWTSFLTVQNAGTSSANITVDYYAEGNPTSQHQDSATGVPPGVSVDFNIAEASYATDLGSTFKGSAVVSCTQPLAVIDDQTTPSGQTQSYNGLAAGAQTVYVPDLYNGYYSWVSSINIQNMGTVPTTVTVNYSDGVTKYCNSLVAGGSCLLYQPTEGHASGTRFSATITSDTEDIVAIVNQAVNATNQAQTYLGMTGGTQRALMPKIMKGYYGWVTSFSVQNIGSGPTDITVTYSPKGGYGGTSYTIYSLAAGDSYQAYQGNDINILSGQELPSGYRGSVVVTSSAEDIIATVNETSLSPGSGDWSASTNAVNMPTP